MRLIEVYFDGCCEPRNPGGHGSWGALLKIDGQVVFQDCGYVGVGRHISNNVSEYEGAIHAMEEVLKLVRPGDRVVVRGDSKLVVMQLSGAWEARETDNSGKPLLYFPRYQRACQVRDAVSKLAGITFQWVPREQNDECDVLSKQVLKNRGVEFRLQSYH